MTTAIIRNAGPIEQVLIPIPAEGGVIVFRGRNGSGKTTALNTIDSAVSKRGRVAVRDGQMQAEFEGFGVRMTVGRSTRRTGEAEVRSLEGRLDVSTLVDPGIDNPEAADAKRIKALVTLVGAKADPTLFYPLVGGAEAFDRLVSPAAITHTDLIAMTGAIKRDLEAKSRAAEGESTNLKTRAEAARKATEGIDLDAPSDARELQAELEQAVSHKAKVEADAQAAQRAIAAAEHAKESLTRSAANYDGPTVPQATSDLATADEDVSVARTAVEAAEKALQQAKQRLTATQAERERLSLALKRAADHARMSAEWQAQIDSAASVKPVHPGDLVRAKARVDECRQQLEQAAIIRKAQEQLAEAEKLERHHEKLAAEADQLRAAAKATDEVLSGVVARSGVPLKVEPVNSQMRLTIQTARGRTCFGELSDGERWRLALDIAIQAVGKSGELTIEQAAWEGLDPVNREAIAEQARAAGVLIYTAEATDGDLRAEVYQNGAA